MNIFDFLTADELDDAPEDPTMAFTHLLRLMQVRLDRRLDELSEMEGDSHSYDDARLGFMSTVISLGKTYGIDPFATMEVPRYKRFGYDEFRQFKGDLDHYLAQLVMGNALRARRDSFKLSADAKSRIRSHLHHVKEHIDKADMPEAKRAVLHAKLREFEAALEKDRLNVVAAGAMVLGILSASASVATLCDSSTFQKLLSNVMVTVAEEKAADDETRQLPPVDPPPVLLPPRRVAAWGERDDDLDDEIPF